MANREFAMESLVNASQKFASWSDALFYYRKKRQLSVVEVANSCGEGKRAVLDWENGIAFPRRGRVLARLYGVLPDLRQHDDLIPRDVKTFIENDAQEEKKNAEKRRETIVEVTHFKDKFVAAKEADEKMKAEDAYVASAVPMTWVEAFTLGMTAAGVTRSEVAELMGVTRSAVDSWVNNRNTPVKDHWDKLVTMFPGLAVFSVSVRDMEKPGREHRAPYRSPGTPVTLAPVPRPPTIEEAAVAYATALQESTRLAREVYSAEEKLIEAQILVDDAKKRAEEAQARATTLHDDLLRATGAKT